MYGNYVLETMKEYVKEYPYVSKQDIAKEYFKTYNAMMNTVHLCSSGEVNIIKDRDPPICMFIGSYKLALSMVIWSDEDYYERYLNCV